MNSLVVYGFSSESDSDGDAEDVNNDEVSCVQVPDKEASAVKRSRNFLLEHGSSSSESDSGPEPETADPQPSSLSHKQAPASAASFQPTLPPPSLTSSKLPPPPLNTCSDSSVFANPFKAQADQKLSALQKHVPLTMQAKPSQIGGKRVCVSYRKDGRCRFGIKCKFAHDSDLQTPLAQPDSHLPVSEEPAASNPESHQPETKEEESGGQQGKKRKVGLSNTLIPPKRALKQYAMLRDREGLNMS